MRSAPSAGRGAIGAVLVLATTCGSAAAPTRAFACGGTTTLCACAVHSNEWMTRKNTAEAHSFRAISLIIATSIEVRFWRESSTRMCVSRVRNWGMFPTRYHSGKGTCSALPVLNFCLFLFWSPLSHLSQRVTAKLIETRNVPGYSATHKLKKTSLHDSDVLNVCGSRVPELFRNYLSATRRSGGLIWRCFF